MIYKLGLLNNRPLNIYTSQVNLLHNLRVVQIVRDVTLLKKNMLLFVQLVVKLSTVYHTF